MLKNVFVNTIDPNGDGIYDEIVLVYGSLEVHKDSTHNTFGLYGTFNA